MSRRTRIHFACLSLVLVVLGCKGSSSQDDAGMSGGGSGGGSGGSGSGGDTSGSGGSGTGGTSGSGGSTGSKDAGSHHDAGSTRDAGSGGAGGHDAGKNDASNDSGSGARTYSTNRADFFGKSRCDKAGTLVCEDFESGNYDTTIWHTKFDTPMVDAMRAARGTKALHLSTTATGGSGIETSKIFPAMSNRYYGRMFVNFDALPSAPQWAHWTIMGANPAQGGSGINGEIRVGGQYDGKINRWGIGTDGGPTGDWTNLDNDPAGNPTKVPEHSWVCIEWEHDGETNQTHFWADGVEHMSLFSDRDVKRQGTPGVKYDLPDFASVWVGFINYNQNQTVTPSHFDVWVDEVALDSERIGCSL